MPEKLIGDIQKELGSAFIAYTGNRGLSSHERPSAAVLLENGQPLPGPPNALHDEIRRIGRGRYCFWHNSVYFSTPDNTDPRTNGRVYSIRYNRDIGRLSLPLQLIRKLRCGSARFLAPLLNSESRSNFLWGALYWTCFVFLSVRKRFTWKRDRF